MLNKATRIFCSFFQPQRNWIIVLVSLTSSFTLATTLVAQANTSNGGTPIVTNIVRRVRVGWRPDLMSTVEAREFINAFPLDGQVYYLPRNNLRGTTPFYRLYHPNIAGHMDHMDSTSHGEGGYSTESPLGYPFTDSNASRGLANILRTFNPSNGDHGLRSPNEQLPGHIDEPRNVFGWPRYLNQSTSFLPLSAGGVTIESNRITGGAIWHWTHNGVQYINNRDYGRQIQSSMFFSHNNKEANPTEAGDRWGDFDRPAWARQGSPLETAYNSGSTQITRSIPLDFNPDRFGGGTDYPVVWKDISLGKNIELNFNNLGPVAKYTTVATIPNKISNVGIEIPTAYLRSEFNRFWTYDTETGTLKEVFPSSACTDQRKFVKHNPNYGGVIISNSSQTRALGVYGVNTSKGGSVSFFLLFNFLCAGDGAGEYNFDTTKWTAIREGSIEKGTNIYNTWLMSGSVSDVTRYMNALHKARVK
jgi:hypothetical protein